MNPRLQLQLLGAFEVSLDGVRVAFRYDKVRALLAYLAMAPEQARARDELVGLLWPEAIDADARRNLSQALFNLRRNLGDRAGEAGSAEPFLFASRDTIQFNSRSDFGLDVAEFETLLDTQAAHCHGSVICAPCAAHLQAAAALYRGDFLQDFYLPDSTSFEEWALLKREELRRRALGAFSRLAVHFEQQGDYEQGLHFTRRQLILEPWREEAHRDLMRMLALSGQRSAALAQFEASRKALADELGVEPSLATRALYDDIRTGVYDPSVLSSQPGAARPQPAAAQGLPTLATPFVGRALELAQIESLLADSNCHLITLVGPGGVGKTRLALQVAATQRAAYQERVFYVPLTPVNERAQMIQAIAHAAGLPLSGPAAAEIQLLKYLAGRPSLLVLDNFEHLSDAVPLLLDILQQAPAAKLLVTSRETLNVSGEWVIDVGGLPVDAAAIEAGGALALFEQTARRTRVGFTLSEADRPAATLVCQLVGGLPLGIEIAASWTRVLSCQEIAEEIQRDLGFLTTTSRDVPERHRSIRGVLEQAWHMLTANEQQLLRRLAAFRGGFQREAAVHVAGASLTQLATLNAKALLRLPEAGRYDLHELIRQYASERLAEDDQLQAATRQKHAEYFAKWLEARAEPVRSAQQSRVGFEVQGETANWHAAWQWAVAHRRLDLLRRMMTCLGWYFEVTGNYAEAIALFLYAETNLRAWGAPTSLNDPAELATFAFVLDNLGWFLFRTGQVEAATTLFTESLPLAGPDAEVSYYILGNWGFMALLSGDLPNALRLTEACLTDARRLESAWHMAIPINVLGMIAHARGQTAEAYDQLRESLRLWRTVGDPRGLVFCLNSLGAAALELGRHDEAVAALQESQATAERNGDRWAQAIALGLLGQVSLLRGEWAAARASLERSVELHRAIGDEWSAAQGIVHLGDAAAGLGDARAASELYTGVYATARAAGWWPTALEAVAGLAAVRAAERPVAALEAVLGVMQHAAVPPRIRDRVRQLLADLTQRLAPPQVEAATGRAQSAEFDVLAAGVLAVSAG